MSSQSGITAPYGFFEAQVVRSRRLGPTMVRVTFGGEQLKGFASGGRDQSLSLFLPHPGQDAPVLPIEEGEHWFTAWRALPEDVRAVMRSYTVRAQRREPDEVDVDFALHGLDGHGTAGPAARWAAGAAPGDRVVMLGPAVAADETALPAAGGILEQLPAGTAARVWIEVPHAEDIQDLEIGAGVELTWLIRDAGATPLVEAVQAADLPEGTLYAWIAGESGTVRALRRHLVGERGVDRRAVTFSGYWRRGASEEQLRLEALSDSSADGE
jgi:NADPH-dependent ferric siderophore reductase